VNPLTNFRIDRTGASKELDFGIAGDRHGPVDRLAACLQDALVPVTEFRRHSLDARIQAVITLRETGRTWYVVETRLLGGTLEVMGYEPRCQHHAPGDGWFVLPAAFFTRACEATGDELDVRIERSDLTLAEADDLSF
jgi:hypothetical protein